MTATRLVSISACLVGLATNAHAAPPSNDQAAVESACAVAHAPLAGLAPPPSSIPRGSGPACPNCVIELHVVVDTAFQQAHGPDTVAVAIDTVDRADEILSAPQAEGGLELRLIDTFGTKFAGPNPWTHSSDGFTLLSNFRNWVNAELDLPGETRDLVVLFTGANLNGSLYAVSFPNSLCSHAAIAVISIPVADTEFDANLLVHTIGHMLGAGHDGVDNGCDPDDYIMSATINALDPATEFSQCSIDEVNAFIDANGSCLAPYPCSAIDYAEPFGVLNFSDVLEFLVRFAAMDHTANLAPDFSVFDFSDVLAFLTAFGEGCP